MSVVGRLMSLRADDWRDLIAAQWALLRAAWRVRREPIGTLAARGPAEAGPVAGDPVRARQVALAVNRAAEYGVFRPQCLVRVIALQDRLKAAGIGGSTVRIGVRRGGREFAAHAWVMWNGEVLGDLPEHVASFTEVEDLRVIGGR